MQAYLVSSHHLDQVHSYYSYPHQEGTYSDLGDFERYAVAIDQARITAAPGKPEVPIMAPGTAAMIHVVASQGVTSALLYPERVYRAKEHPVQPDPKKVNATLAELANGRELLFKICVTDKTLAESLESDYYRVGLMKNAAVPGIRSRTSSH